MERTNSRTVRVIPDARGRIVHPDGRIVRLPVAGHLQGVCLAAGFVGSGGRNVAVD
jgi:hypothetical protein